MGQGRTEHYVYFSDPALGSGSDYVSYSKRQRVKTKFKTPLSLSFGLTYKMRHSKIHLTCEYFFDIKRYYLLEKPDDAEFVDGDVAFNSASTPGVIRQMKDVLNFALGIERTITKKITLLLGINSDHNAAPDQSINTYNNNFSMGNYNLTHASLGVAFTHNKNNIAVGITGSWGSKLEGPLANFKDPNDLYRFFGTSFDQNSTHSYRSIALVVGLTY